MNQKDVEGPEENMEKTLDIGLKDAEGNPMANEPYQVSHSGKIVAEGRLDATGKASVTVKKGIGYKVRCPDQQSMKKSR